MATGGPAGENAGGLDVSLGRCTKTISGGRPDLPGDYNQDSHHEAIHNGIGYSPEHRANRGSREPERVKGGECQ